MDHIRKGNNPIMIIANLLPRLIYLSVENGFTSVHISMCKFQYFDSGAHIKIFFPCAGLTALQDADIIKTHGVLVLSELLSNYLLWDSEEKKEADSGVYKLISEINMKRCQQKASAKCFRTEKKEKRLIKVKNIKLIAKTDI